MATINGRQVATLGSSIVNTGTLTVRDSSGTKGVTIVHNGTNGVITATVGGNLLLDSDVSQIVFGANCDIRGSHGTGVTQLTIASTGVYNLSGSLFAWSNHATSLTSGAIDTCLFRVAAAVVAPGGAAAVNPGWLQNTAGRKIKDALQTVTDSATLVNDTHFQFTLVAGRKYSFKGHYHVTTVATSGVKIDFDGGAATATSFDVMCKFFTASAVAVTTATAIATDHGSTAAVLVVEFEGTIVVNAGGTFIVRFAQNAETGAAESVTARLGSWMMVEDMP